MGGPWLSKPRIPILSRVRLPNDVRVEDHFRHLLSDAVRAVLAVEVVADVAAESLLLLARGRGSPDCIRSGRFRGQSGQPVLMSGDRSGRFSGHSPSGSGGTGIVAADRLARDARWDGDCDYNWRPLAGPSRCC